MSHTRESRIIKSIYLFSFLISTALAAFLISKNAAWAVLAGAELIFLSAGLLLVKTFRKRGKSCNWLIILAVVNFIVMVPELSLRIADFRYESGIHNTSHSQFGGLRPESYKLFVPDKDLFWKLPASEPHVNSHGFPGPEFEEKKPPNVFRILFLGDSVTQLGFARYVESFLNAVYRMSGIRYECISLGVAGYSSYQGRILAELYGKKLNPDLAVVMFGWNDHWLAYRARDSRIHSLSSPGIVRKIYHRLRILQLINMGVHYLLKSNDQGILNEVRVTEKEYRQNLNSIDSIFKNADVPVIFMTSPTTHYKLGVPEYLVEEKYVNKKEEATYLHRQYNNIVKDLAKEKQDYLLDLEKEFNQYPNIHICNLFRSSNVFKAVGVDLNKTLEWQNEI